jgi:hypothetical protein
MKRPSGRPENLLRRDFSNEFFIDHLLKDIEGLRANNR